MESFADSQTVIYLVQCIQEDNNMMVNLNSQIELDLNNIVFEAN